MTTAEILRETAFFLFFYGVSFVLLYLGGTHLWSLRMAPVPFRAKLIFGILPTLAVVAAVVAIGMFTHYLVWLFL